jgi:hypothetical protein
MEIERQMALSKKHFATAVDLLDVSNDIKEVHRKWIDDVRTLHREQPNYEGLGYGAQGFDKQFAVHVSSRGGKEDMRSIDKQD